MTHDYILVSGFFATVIGVLVYIKAFSHPPIPDEEDEATIEKAKTVVEEVAEIKKTIEREEEAIEGVSEKADAAVSSICEEADEEIKASTKNPEKVKTYLESEGFDVEEIFPE